MELNAERRVTRPKVAATVVAQSDVAAARYGKFRSGWTRRAAQVHGDGWGVTSPTTRSNQLANAGQRVTETFEVATSDGGKASVTVIITGSEDVAQLSSDSKTLTEETRC